MNSAGHWCRRVNSVLALVFAVAIAFPITYAYVVVVAGLVVLVISDLSLYIGNKRSAKGNKTNELAFSSLTTSPLLIPLAVFCLASCICGCANGGIKEGIGTIEAIRAFIVYPWAYATFHKCHDLQIKAIQLFISISTIAAVWGTIQQLKHFHPFTKNFLQGTGFLSSPMPFAGEMQLAFTIALAFAISKKEVLDSVKRLTTKSSGKFTNFFALAGNRIFWILALVATSLGVLYSGERSAWLGAVAGAAAITVMRSRQIFAGAIACLTFCITGAWFMVPLVRQRLEPLLNWKTDVSSVARVKVWQQAIALFLKSPIFGTGPRRFPLLDMPEATGLSKSTYLVHGHSNYLHVLATTGITGSLAFLWLSWSMLASCFVEARAKFQSRNGDSAGGDTGTDPIVKSDLQSSETPEEKPVVEPVDVKDDDDNYDKKSRSALALGLLGGVAALMVAGVFEYNFGTGQVRLAQWYLLAMIMRPQEPTDSADNAKTSKQPAGVSA